MNIGIRLVVLALALVMAGILVGGPTLLIGLLGPPLEVRLEAWLDRLSPQQISLFHAALFALPSLTCSIPAVAIAMRNARKRQNPGVPEGRWAPRSRG